MVFQIFLPLNMLIIYLQRKDVLYNVGVNKKIFHIIHTTLLKKIKRFKKKFIKKKKKKELMNI